MEYKELVDIIKAAPGFSDFNSGNTDEFQISIGISRFKVVRDSCQNVTIKWQSFVVRSNEEDKEIQDITSLLGEIAILPC